MEHAAMNTLRLDCATSGLATLTLTQGGRGNPIDAAFIAEFRQAVLGLWDWPGIRCVLIRAEGTNFCVGGDVKFFASKAETLPAVVREWTSELHPALVRLWRLPVPVVVEVQGLAVGGALGLVGGCDVVVCSRSTRLGAAFTGIGFSNDSGTSVVLSMRMGAARARRFQLLAETLTAEEAVAAGLADIAVADGELQAAALGVATRLASGPTLAYGQIKRLFAQIGGTQVEAQLENEALALAAVAASNDAREGLKAFAERRKPVFTGK